MKKLILILLLFAGYVSAQDISTTVQQSYYDTLTTTNDSLEVRFYSPIFDYYTVVAKSTTGADTITVETISRQGTIWSKKNLIKLSDKSNNSQIISSTTAEEYLIYDPEIWAIRFLVTDTTSASTILNVMGKK